MQSSHKFSSMDAGYDSNEHLESSVDDLEFIEKLSQQKNIDTGQIMEQESPQEVKAKRPPSRLLAMKNSLRQANKRKEKVPVKDEKKKETKVLNTGGRNLNYAFDTPQRPFSCIPKGKSFDEKVKVASKKSNQEKDIDQENIGLQTKDKKMLRKPSKIGAKSNISRLKKSNSVEMKLSEDKPYNQLKGSSKQSGLPVGGGFRKFLSSTNSLDSDYDTVKNTVKQCQQAKKHYRTQSDSRILDEKRDTLSTSDQGKVGKLVLGANGNYHIEWQQGNGENHKSMEQLNTVVEDAGLQEGKYLKPKGITAQKGFIENQQRNFKKEPGDFNGDINLSVEKSKPNYRELQYSSHIDGLKPSKAIGNIQDIQPSNIGILQADKLHVKDHCPSKQDTWPENGNNVEINGSVSNQEKDNYDEYEQNSSPTSSPPQGRKLTRGAKGLLGRIARKNAMKEKRKQIQNGMKRSHTFQGIGSGPLLEGIPESNSETSEESWSYNEVATSNGKVGGLRVTNPEDLKKKETPQINGHAKLPQNTRPAIPRRHTVTVGSMDIEMAKDKQTHQQKEAFLDHLAHRYPEHAHVIKGNATGTKGRPREDLRRKTTTVTYNPDHNQSYVYDSDDTAMSEAGTSPTGGGFQRGTKARNSLPVVRSPNKSMEKPLGLVFLIFRNETKRALLPNEITSMDTVKALFVRSFPDGLSMDNLSSPWKKIYIMDPTTNVYYELDDLRDIKDRTVLKVYEREPIPDQNSSPLMSPKRQPLHQLPPQQYYNSGHESDSSVRSAPPRSPVHGSRFNAGSGAKGLQSQANYVSLQELQQYGHLRYSAPPSQHRSPTHQPHPHPHPHRPTAGSNQNSPQRTLGVHQGPSGPQRHSVAYLPNPDAVNMNVPQSRSYSDYYDPGQRSGSVTPTMVDMEARTRMDKMEMEIANLAAMVQHQVKDGSRPASTTGSEASYSAKSSMSDISSATPQPMISVDMQNSIRALNHKAKELKSECRSIRRQHIANQETMRDTINSTFKQIKDVLVVVPGANDQPLRSHRGQMDVKMNIYKDSATRVTKDLVDLESSVEDLRNDVLNKKCRVNVQEVEAMALALSNISKTLGDLKGRFPELQEDMKSVMSGEMEIVVKEEKFLKEEPERLDIALKRCKKLTGTLYTLKRLSSIQEQKAPTQKVITAIPDGEDPRKAVLANIEAMVPNHTARVQGVEACENARERKKKITSQVESLRFEKSLEMAQKQLRETKNMEENEQRAEKVLTGLFRGQDNIEVTVKPDKNSHNTMDLVAQNGHSTVQRKVSMGEADKPVAPSSPKTGQGPTRIPPPQQQKKCPLSPPAPKKPPRTMEYADTPPMARSKSPEKVVVKSPTNGLSNGNAQSNTSVNQSNNFSTFSTPPTGKISPVSSPIVNNNNSVSSLQSLAGKSSMSQPNTSTPKSHVTFNPAVTEIKESGGQTDISKAKKIPPPPPPRRSSRLMSPSTVEPNSGDRCFSPPTYENIESLTGQTTSPDEPVWVSQRSLQAKQGKSPAENINGKGQGSRIQKPRPLNKFQHEIAAGIYANMNRPDLQEQSTVPAEVVRNKDKTNGGANQSPSDSESSLDSQTGTVKRKPKSANDNSGNTDTNKAGKEVKKVPPPPPVRKSSALTANESNKKSDGKAVSPQEQYHKLQQLQRDHIYQNPHEVKQRSQQNMAQKYGAKPQAQLPQNRNNAPMQQAGKVVTNGDVKKIVQPKAVRVVATKPGNSNTAPGQGTINRRSEETEIF